MFEANYVGDGEIDTETAPDPTQPWIADGREGDDVLTGGTNDDVLIGGENDDTLTGGQGDDRLDGDGGFQEFIPAPPGVPVDGFEKTAFYSGSDTLHGDAGDDILAGGNGNDFLYGGDDNDLLGDAFNLTTLLVGGEAYDFLGEPMVDFSNTDPDNDTLDGGDGDDTIVSARGVDIIIGGDGEDDLALYRGEMSGPNTNAYTIDISDGGGGRNIGDGTTITGIEQMAVETGSGADTITGGAKADVISSGRGNDVVEGGGGADVLNVGRGIDVARGGAGSDTLIVRYGDQAGPVTTSLGGSFATGYNGRFTINASDNVFFTGIESFDVEGSDADGDMIVTGAGADRLDGGAGADTMKGGLGNDTYVVDSVGDAIIEGANGGSNDTVETLIDYNAVVRRDAHIETIISRSFGASLTGNGLDNTIVGDFGANIINGSKGADTMSGLEGDDIYYVDNIGDVVIEVVAGINGPGGVDTVRSSVSYTLGDNVENLILYGVGATTGTGNDLVNRIAGDAQQNTIIGGGNADILTGGAAFDYFVYNSVSDSIRGRYDRITDFNSDRIDLTNVDADSTADGNQDFALVDAFTSQAGQLTITFDAANNWTDVQGDVNGDGVADFRLLLLGGDKTGLINDFTLLGVTGLIETQ